MVQIYLAGQTCGKIEEISRSWWQCATANEAVKHLVNCDMYLFKGGQVHLQYMIQIVKFPGFGFQTSVATWRGVRDMLG